MLCTDVMQEQRTIGGDPDILQAIPNLLGHGVLRYGAEQAGERSIGFGLPLDVLDDEFTVVAKKVLDQPGGKTLSGGWGLIKRPDGENELPCFHWLFAGEIVALPEGPEERVVFGRLLGRGLEGDPGFCQLGALAVGQDKTAGFGEFGQHASRTSSTW